MTANNLFLAQNLLPALYQLELVTKDGALFHMDGYSLAEIYAVFEEFQESNLDVRINHDASMFIDLKNDQTLCSLQTYMKEI